MALQPDRNGSRQTLTVFSFAKNHVGEGVSDALRPLFRRFRPRFLPFEVGSSTAGGDKADAPTPPFAASDLV